MLGISVRGGRDHRVAGERGCRGVGREDLTVKLCEFGG
jgi:hypothetical protein